MAQTSYAVALGGNRRGRHGSPRAEVVTAAAALGEIVAGGVVAMSRVVESAALGPSLRRYANAVVLVVSDLSPPAMLARCKAIERAFGRRRGQRWGARVIDLDLVLWSGGRWRSPGLAVPHPAFRGRAFVLQPLLEVAPAWRDPVTGLSVRQLHARLTGAGRVPRR